MNAPARDLTVEVTEAAELAAALADYDDQLQKTLASFLESLAELSESDPNDVFERTVAEHRDMVKATENLLCTLNGAGTTFLRTAQRFPELHRELERVLPTAHRNLRITRALSARLAGKPALNYHRCSIQSPVAQPLRAI